MLCCSMGVHASISPSTALPIRMRLSSSHPALTPIKSTSPPTEAQLSARSVFWSPSCPPWTSSFVACRYLPSLAAQVRPLLPGTWACSRWISEQSLSGLNHIALPGQAETGCDIYIFFLMHRDNGQCCITAVTRHHHCDQNNLCDCEDLLLSYFRINVA